MISFLIVVPTLNSYQILPPLIESLLEQTYSNWRVIFVDGPSHPEHRDWLQSIQNRDARFQWQEQTNPGTGIFGAMNQGMGHADERGEWLLFWGSDDQASSPKVFENVATKLEQLKQRNNLPDLYICNGRYCHILSNANNDLSISLGRKTCFTYQESFRKSLFLGSTPPHQATFFGPSSYQKLSQFDSDLRLAADLDYFLKLSEDPSIHVCTDDVDVVWIGDSGVSGKQTRRRLNEVYRAYRRTFGIKWWVPFCLRYREKIGSLLKSS